MTSVVQRSFAAGEIAPAVQGRADLVKYQTGLRTCRNFRVMRHGGVENRPGTGVVAEQKDSSARSKLHKFVFNAEQTYVLRFEDHVLQIIQAGARIVVSGVAAYNALTAYVQGDLVLQGGIHYYAKQATTGNAPPNATYWHPLTGVIYEIPTPYITADLPLLLRDQSGDVVTLTHPGYPTMELRRTGTTAWTLTATTIGPTQQPPTNPLNDGAAAGPDDVDWVVTAINSETFEESLPTAATNSTTAPTSGSPVTITWTNASGAGEYNVYKAKNGVYGFIGVSSDGTIGFEDNDIAPDTTETPPKTRNPFGSTNNYPATSGYWQQRHIFGNTRNDPEKAWTSKTGSFRNFSVSSPLQDDDGVTFTLSGNEVQEIRHFLSLGQLIALTSGGEWTIRGDSDGVLRPTAINPVQEGYTGSSWVKPAVVGNSAIYVQARGSTVRDLRYSLETNGYSGRDLSVFSTHLFEGYTIVALDYQQIPHSTVWFVRSDGVLLGLTYMREHEIWGWHRHDTDGFYEDVVCVPEGEEDAVYVTVRRTINGVTKRFTERFYSRRVTDVSVDAKFVDCGLTYDGRNTGSTTVTLSGGTTWAHTETLTVTAGVGTPFVSGDVGNAVVVWEDQVQNEGQENETTTRHKVTITITGYTSTSVVTGRANKTVPTILRTGARTTWGKAVDDITGLGHLEGKSLAILADGNVVSNGRDSPMFVVSSGAIHLPRPYMVIHAGLPYLSDFETLDLEVLGGETILDKRKNMQGATFVVQDSRGMWTGPNLEIAEDGTDTLHEWAQREVEDWGEPTRLYTGKVELDITAGWDSYGRVAARQRDPLPLSILSVIPRGDIGG